MLEMPQIRTLSDAEVERIKEKYSSRPKKPELNTEAEPKNEAEILSFYLQKFTSFRYDYLDEIPDHILKPGDSNYARYKCRGNWWTKISGNIQNLMRFGLLKDAAIQQEIQKFFDYLAMIDARKRAQMNRNEEPRYTKDDLSYADAFLDSLIAHVSILAHKADPNKYPPGVG